MRPQRVSHSGCLVAGVRACQAEPESHDEAQFVAALRERSPEAWSRLYLQCHPGIYRYFRSRVGASAAEDLAATVFLNAYEGISSFTYRGPPVVAWLQRIARNLLLSHARSSRVHGSIDEAVAGETKDYGPEDYAVLSDDVAVLREALLCLKADQRRVIDLRFLRDLRHQEVAAAMGRSTAAVRVLQHRALRELKQQMQPRRSS